MAEYKDLPAITNDDDFRNRTAMALAIAAEVLLSGTPTADDSRWAYDVLSNPLKHSKITVNFIIAQFNTATVTAILSAPDTGAGSLQAAVDGVVTNLVAAYNLSVV